jgi:hypothetical protein
LRELKVITASNEEMHVIGHHHIPSHGHAKLVTRSADVGLERAMGCF